MVRLKWIAVSSLVLLASACDLGRWFGTPGGDAQRTNARLLFSKLKVTAPTSMVAGTCTAIQAEPLDAQGAVTVSKTTVFIVAKVNDISETTLFEDAGCSEKPVSAVALKEGQRSVSFYVLPTTLGELSIEPYFEDRSMNLPVVGPKIAVTHGPPARVVFDEIPRQLEANGAFTLKLKLQDAYGNLAAGYAGTVRLAVESANQVKIMGGEKEAQWSEGQAIFENVSFTGSDPGAVLVASTAESVASKSAPIFIFPSQPVPIQVVVDGVPLSGFVQITPDRYSIDGEVLQARFVTGQEVHVRNKRYRVVSREPKKIVLQSIR